MEIKLRTKNKILLKQSPISDQTMLFHMPFHCSPTVSQVFSIIIAQQKLFYSHALNKLQTLMEICIYNLEIQTKREFALINQNTGEMSVTNSKWRGV